MGKSLRIIPNNLFNLILISHTWIINLFPPTLRLSLSLSFWEGLRSNASLTLLSITLPPFLSLTHSLHLLHEHEPAAFSASPSVFELFWHMRSLSASLPLSFFSVFSPIPLHTSLFPPLQDRKKEHQRRRLTTITGRGSGQWPVWEGSAVRQLWFNTFRRWRRKPHQRRREKKRAKEPLNLLDSWEKTSTTWGREIKTFLGKKL